MSALFKKLLKLFARKEDSATKFYKGIISLDQQALEIRTVVTRVMSFVEIEAKSTFQTETKVSLDQHNTWRLCIGKDGEIDLTLSLNPFDCCGGVVFCTARNTGFRQPCFEDIELAHQRLSFLVEGVIEKFPSLKYKFVSYFNAADK